MVGTLSVSVSYRTKMTISPTQTVPGKDAGMMMLKSDHFIKDLSPKQQMLWQNNNNNNNFNNLGGKDKTLLDKKTVDLTKPMKLGAFVDFNRTRKYSEDDYILPETPPFSWLLRKNNEDANNNSSEAPREASAAPPAVGGSAAVTAPVDVPVACSNNNNNKENENVKRSSVEEQKAMGALLGSQRPSRWSVSPTLDEEKFLKELHFPFATTNTPIGDLAKFYRECKQAPPLQGLSGVGGDVLLEEESEIEDLTQKLEEFETALPEFDSLVSSLYVQQSTYEETCSH